MIAQQNIRWFTTLCVYFLYVNLIQFQEKVGYTPDYWQSPQCLSSRDSRNIITSYLFIIVYVHPIFFAKVTKVMDKIEYFVIICPEIVSFEFFCWDWNFCETYFLCNLYCKCYYRDFWAHINYHNPSMTMCVFWKFNILPAFRINYWNLTTTVSFFINLFGDFIYYYYFWPFFNTI